VKATHVTKNQPFKGVTSVVSGEVNGEINVFSGRKRSLEPAVWFNKQTDIKIATYDDADMLGPSKLNFAIEGEIGLIFKDNTKPINIEITLAQGLRWKFPYMDKKNVWWLGVENNAGNGFKCSATNSTIMHCSVILSDFSVEYFQIQKDGNNAFVINNQTN
jgi:hypothetical protein